MFFTNESGCPRVIKDGQGLNELQTKHGANFSRQLFSRPLNESARHTVACVQVSERGRSDLLP